MHPLAPASCEAACPSMRRKSQCKFFTRDAAFPVQEAGSKGDLDADGMSTAQAMLNCNRKLRPSTSQMRTARGRAFRREGQARPTSPQALLCALYCVFGG